MEPLQLLSATGLLVAGYWAILKIALRQFETRLDERFAAQEKVRVEAKKDWDAKFEKTLAEQRTVERSMADLNTELHRDFWRREDAVRNDTVIDAKLDAMNARLDRFLTLQANCPLTGRTQRACALAGAKEKVNL